MSSRFSTHRRSATRVAAVLAAAGLCLTGVNSAGAQTTVSVPKPDAGSVAPIADVDIPDPFTEEATGLADLDTRGQVAPLASQRAAVPAGADVRWNRYGTPASLSKVSGYLSGPSSAAPADAARSWLHSNASLFGLSGAQINDLALVSDTRLPQSKAHVVRFRQSYAGLTAAVDGMVTVGLTPDRRVAYVSSSLARVKPGVTLSPANLSPVTAWSKAALNAGELAAGVTLPTKTYRDGEWTTFKVDGFAQAQQVRQRALAMPDGTVHRVYEANVLHSAAGEAVAYTSFVDASNGTVFIRHNQVDNLSTVPMMTDTAEPFQGTFSTGKCGQNGPFTVDNKTKSIVVTASSVVPAEDIVLNLKFNGAIVASSDTATSPEAITYSPPGGVPAGDYTVEVCEFPNPTVPTVVGEYVGVFIATEQETPQAGIPYPPKWKYFLANPVLDFSDTATTDDRQIGCWVNIGTNCDTPPSPLINTAARAPWDYNVRSNTPTFTTVGNDAFTAEAWFSPLTPGPIGQRPVSPDRNYGFSNPGQDFTDAWNNTQCSPLAFNAANNNNDILASVTNLFAGHNRFHDYSYFLGFTEGTYNLQDSNFGNRAQGGVSPTGGEGDPEVGNVQAGAISGGPPSYLGRDNANQITLQDGVPGITNQYLFQPIAGAFYSPCVDGDFDAPVYGHEYTHAISNRMVAGPDAGLSGFQAGSMGESWSDLVALEYLFEHSYDIGTKNPWVEGPYVTGNKVTGIRNYALNKNPLQYGDLGYDITGAEVHADGEVWNTTMFDVRRELVAKYNAKFPESNKALQLRCADGSPGVTTNSPREAPLPADQCPGGRRWIQLIFDSFLMQDSATSMLDARDAYLAADKMRFGGRDLAALWRGFAGDGMGEDAMTKGTEDDEPTSDYTSPFANEGTLKITGLGLDGQTPVKVPGTLYVGDYEARVTPIADTKPGTALPNTVQMVPGRYDFVFQANGYGLNRFSVDIKAGKVSTREVHLSTNMASSFSGATIAGFFPATSMNTTKLIDDTEGSNWAGIGPAGSSVDVTNPFVNVNLAGGKQLVRSVKVSALLRPQDKAQEESERQPDKSSGSRFTALRKFAIETCTDTVTSDCSSLLPAGKLGSPYTRIYTSPADAFNGVAPRPLAPALLFERFDVPDTRATHVRLVALENQCTGQAQFAGEQDADPLNPTDCKTGSNKDESVRAAELEVFSYDAQTKPPGDPVVAMVMTGDAVASAGDPVTYRMTYTNLGPKPSSQAQIRVSELAPGLRFVSSNTQVAWDSTSRSLLWRLGTVPVGATNTVTLKTTVAKGADLGDVLLTQAQFSGAYTFSPPAAAVTVVGP